MMVEGVKGQMMFVNNGPSKQQHLIWIPHTLDRILSTVMIRFFNVHGVGSKVR